MTARGIPIKTAFMEKKIHADNFNSAVSVDCVIIGYEEKSLKVLLIKSDLKEFAGNWSLLGDLVRPKEDLRAASCRVMKKYTGLKDVYLEQVQAFGHPSRHPSGRVVTIAYYALVDLKNYRLRVNEENLTWVPVAEVGTMAFDHRMILENCLQRLRGLVIEKPIAFNLLQTKFSLREVQEVYETIQGFPIDRRNFRKKIALKKWLVDLGETERGVTHRPGKLYRLCKKQSVSSHRVE